MSLVLGIDTGGTYTDGVIVVSNFHGISCRQRNCYCT
jgi:N-methylhydantoinase A/oxoprolinase/acetone carboxylase beta subunit